LHLSFGWDTKAYRGHTDGRRSHQQASKVHHQRDMLCKHQSVFVDTRKRQWIFENLATESAQQTIVCSAECRVLKDEFGSLSLAMLSLLFDYW